MASMLRGFITRRVLARVLLPVALCTALGLAPTTALTQGAPDRIVTAGGDVTEIVHALGMAGSLVGVDTTSYYPDAVRDLPQIGYMRSLSAEGILALKPDLLIGSINAGPPPVLAQLRGAGVRVETLPDAEDLDGIAAKIAAVGALLGRNAEADAVVATIRARMAQVDKALDRFSHHPRLAFLLDLREGVVLMAGRKTAADGIFRMIRADNVFHDTHEGYKAISAEGMLATAPDAIILMSSRLEALGGLAALQANPVLSRLPAVIEGRVLGMDGILLLGFGPRTPAAAEELARFAYGPDFAQEQP